MVQWSLHAHEDPSLVSKQPHTCQADVTACLSPHIQEADTGDPQSKLDG